MTLSVVILNYNTRSFLKLCLESVARAIAGIEAEVIVVDNASSDQSMKMVKTFFPSFICIENQENVGFSKANNQAVRQASGEYVCILNPDTIVGESVFKSFLAFAKANPKVAFSGPHLMDGVGAFLPESKRNVPTPKVAQQKLLGNNTSYYADLRNDQDGEVEVLVGAFMFCRREVYLELGGFDERYFMYGEDIDLSYTALLSGYKNYYLGTQKVIHFKGESTVKDKMYLKRFYGAMQLFYDKHFKKNSWQRSMVRIGVKILMNRPVKKHKKATPVLNAYVITNKGQSIVRDTPHLSFTQLKNNLPAMGAQIIWDTRDLVYDELIDFMAAHTKNRYTYRFIDQNHNFYAGSDSSTVMGNIHYL